MVVNFECKVEITAAYFLDLKIWREREERKVEELLRGGRYLSFSYQLLATISGFELGRFHSSFD
jgi:hypothetical protein